MKYKVINFASSNNQITAKSGGGLGSGGGWLQGGYMGSGGGGGIVQAGGVRGGGGFVQAGGVRGGGGLFRWLRGRCSDGGFSEGRGAKGQTLGGLKGSEGANVRGIEGEQRGKRRSSTESFCNLSLDFEMD